MFLRILLITEEDIGKKKYINTKQLLLLFHSILAIISDI